MVKSATKSLKAALKSQQSRFRDKQKKERLALAVEHREFKRNKQSTSKTTDSRGKGKPPAVTLQRSTIPFRLTDKILLIGEGNFSFARALIQDPPSELEFLPPGNVTATTYDSEEQCYTKYPEAKEIVAVLREKGAQVLFGVDATRLNRIATLKGRKWDRVVWNFPHAGKGITDQDRNILSNQVLILGFLRSAIDVLASGRIPSVFTPKRKQHADNSDEELGDDHPDDEPGSTPQATQTRGTILITLRNVPPYTLWDVPRLAKNPPLPTSGSTQPTPQYMILRSFVFHRKIWKGYEHRMTKGERAHGTGKTGEGGEDRTWELCLRD